MTPTRLRWGILGTANIGRAAVVPAIASSPLGEAARNIRVIEALYRSARAGGAVVTLQERSAPGSGG